MSKVGSASSSVLKNATKAQTAEFFGISLTGLDSWIRKGAPVVQRGSRGVGWVLDLREVARWRYGGGGREGQSGVDPESLQPADRKAWYEGEARRRELEVKAGKLIAVEDVEAAIATTFAALAQDLRSIPDNLERRHGIDGEVALRVEEALFEVMDALADRLSRLGPVEYSSEEGEL